MKRSPLAVIGLFLLIYIVPLGVRPIIIPDESRYGEIPREMIASGDWIVPHLDGVRYFEKPVLGYWINAVSMTLFGENAFAIRFPSALAVGISALMLFFLVQRFTGEHSAGSLAAVIFLTCGEVFGVGTFNVLDSLISMFITVSMVTFFFAYTEDKPAGKSRFLVLSGIFLGLAFLTKGFIALVIPLVAIGPFMIWERRWKDLLTIWWIPVTGAVIVSLPWAVMINIREPDFWRFFFWNEHIRRFMAGNAQHRASFLYFFLVFPAVAVPWTFLFPAAAMGMKQTNFKKTTVRFAVCWFIFPFLFFSASSGKLGTYILPCFPPFAILMEAGLRTYLESGHKKAFTIGALFLGLVIVISVIALSVLQAVDVHGLRPYSQGWKYALVIAGFSFWALSVLFAHRATGHQRKILLYAAAPALLLFIAPLIVPDQAILLKAPGEFLLRHSKRIQSDSILVSDAASVSAVCWFYRRSDIYLLERAGELGYGIQFDDSKQRLMDRNQFAKMLQKDHGTGCITLIETAKKYKKWKTYLPAPVFEDSNGDDGFVFVQF